LQEDLKIAAKTDVITAAQDIYSGIFGSMGDIKTDASLQWETLLNSYIEGGNETLLKTVLDGSLFNTADFYSVWEAYAQSINTTTIDAIKEAIGGMTSLKRDFELWTLGDSIEALAKKAEWAKADLENLESMVGVTGLTVDNFLESYNQAIKESFTPETLAQWDSLSDALITATDAQNAYKNALLTTLNNELTAWVSALGAVQSAIDTLSPSFKTFAELASTPITLENYSTLLSDLENTRQNEINLLTDATNKRLEQLDNEKTLFISLSDYIDELNLKLMGSQSISYDYFFNELTKAKDVFASGGIVDASKLTQSAGTYLESALQNSSSQLEYFREVARVKEGLGSLGSMVTGGTLHSIEAAIMTEEQTLASKLDAINQTALAILQSWKGTATSNATSYISQINALKGYDPSITAAYANILERTPEKEGGDYWQRLLDTGKTTAQAITPIVAEAAIDELYATVLGREADAAGLAHWTNVVQSGQYNPYQLDELFKEAAKVEINGSHASGLDFVPFDGYRAELHKGERVQTASEVQKDKVITMLSSEIKDLKDIFIKNTAEMTRMSKAIQRVMPDGDALQVRTAS